MLFKKFNVFKSRLHINYKIYIIYINKKFTNNCVDTECLNKLDYYLKNQIEREFIADKGYQLTANELSGKKTMKPIVEKIKNSYKVYSNIQYHYCE